VLVQSHPAPATSSPSSESEDGMASPPSGSGIGVQAPVRHAQVSPTLHGFGEQRSTHLAWSGPALTLTFRQTRFGGQTTPSQSSRQEPFSQCAPAGQRTPTHSESTQAGTGAERSQVSPGRQLEAGAHAHDGEHRPRLQAVPSGQVTSAQGSTQPKPRQICPDGQRTLGLQVGTHVFVSSHVSPGGHPKTVQSSGSQRHVPPSGARAKCEFPGQPKSSSGMHSGTQALARQPFPPEHGSATMPEQLVSSGASHVSGAPGNTAGSVSSQSQGVPDHGQPQAANPSLSPSGQTVPASQTICAAATRGSVSATAISACRPARRTARKRTDFLAAGPDMAGLSSRRGPCTRHLHRRAARAGDQPPRESSRSRSAVSAARSRPHALHEPCRGRRGGAVRSCSRDDTSSDGGLRRVRSRW
jgi:hypothetical protein